MANREIQERLHEMGYELLREGGSHLIYRHANGARLTAPATPSDYRAVANTLAQAAILAGVSKQGREAVEGNRRRKKRALPPAAINPATTGPVIPSPARAAAPRPAAATRIEDGEIERRSVPVVIANMHPQRRRRPEKRVPVAHIRAVDALPKGMRDRVLKLAGGDYSRIKILADNRVEITS